ncbi:MAG: hypothetical protein H6746_20625 [Deltaproteobacteria bacterium]|nr:hypothetical protein [Deltaproteobacteria bacterium]
MLIYTAASSMREARIRRVEDTAVVEAFNDFSEKIARLAGDAGTCDAAEFAARVGMIYPPTRPGFSSLSAGPPDTSLRPEVVAVPARSAVLSMRLCSNQPPFVCAGYDAKLRRIWLALFRSYGGRKTGTLWTEDIVLEQRASGRCESVTKDVGVHVDDPPPLVL